MVEKCLPCQAASDKTQREPLKSIPLPAKPWSSLRVDLYGPVPGSGGEYLLVVQCLYSRFPAVEIVSSTGHKAIIAALERIMSAFGIPDKLGSDNGPPFNGQEFHAFARYMGFQFDPVTHLAPCANGTGSCPTSPRFCRMPKKKDTTGGRNFRDMLGYIDQHRTPQQGFLQPICYSVAGNTRQDYPVAFVKPYLLQRNKCS